MIEFFLDGLLFFPLKMGRLWYQDLIDQYVPFVCMWRIEELRNIEMLPVMIGLIRFMQYSLEE